MGRLDQSPEAIGPFNRRLQISQAQPVDPAKAVRADSQRVYRPKWLAVQAASQYSF